MVSNYARQKLNTAVPMVVLGGGALALFFAFTGGAGAIWRVLGTFAGTVCALLGLYTDQDRPDRSGQWRPSQEATPTATDEQAVTILRQRYARGEIDHAAFEQRLDTLLETEPIEPAVTDRDTTTLTEQSR